MSVDSLFTDSRLAYSASHGSKEWTTTTTRCYWHYVSNNMDYSGADFMKIGDYNFIRKDMGFQVIPYQCPGASWNQSEMLSSLVSASEVMVLSMVSK